MKRDSFPLNYVPLGEPMFTHIHVSFMAEVFTHIDWTAVGWVFPPPFWLFNCYWSANLLYAWNFHTIYFIWIGPGNTIPGKNWSTEYI
jgi:hypothetical protein